MVKFLEGKRFKGDGVAVCAFWSTAKSTNTVKDFSEISNTPNPAGGQCIANAFFSVSDISCFNNGTCNGFVEDSTRHGRCLPCTKYAPNGMGFATKFSHPTAEDTTLQTQLPLKFIIRNIQAEIGKCCFWNASGGAAGKFFLALIRTGTTTRNITDSTGNTQSISGLTITHPEFPDSVGTFVPVGSVVVAGWSDSPQFYLEPKTGLLKDAIGVIITEAEAVSSVKRTAVGTDALINASVQAASEASATAEAIAQISRNKLAFAQGGTDAAGMAALEQEVEENEKKAADAAAALEEAQEKSANALSLFSQLNASTTIAVARDLSSQLSTELESLANSVEITSIGAGGTGQGIIASIFVSKLRERSKSIKEDKEKTRCQFFFGQDNIAKDWNAPEDGSTPCNGVRTDCQFYTGPKWKHATDPKMETGKSITAEQYQEVRFYSEDWTRFSDPDREFRNRFSIPFIWAFKGFIPLGNSPEDRDTSFYKQTGSSFETMLVSKTFISNFENFTISKTLSRVLPGTTSVDLDTAPAYPTLVFELESGNQVNKLKITHPRTESPFIHRSWDPGDNKIAIFGVSNPFATIYLVNKTALKERQRYLDFYRSSNIVEDLPDGLPNLTNADVQDLSTIFSKLQEEKDKTVDGRLPLGFASVVADGAGRWFSPAGLDLIHNRENEIVSIMLLGNNLLFDEVVVDYRFLHALVSQTSFTGTDFSIGDTSGHGENVDMFQLGIATEETAQNTSIKAEFVQLAGSRSEALGFHHGYYSFAQRNRNLVSVVLDPGISAEEKLDRIDEDLQNKIFITETPATVVVADEGGIDIASAAASYSVALIRKTEVIADWYLISDCNDLMLVINDVNVHRVLPVGDARLGQQKALSNILVNGASLGSQIAQWGLEKVELTTQLGGGTTRTVELAQIYRHPDGLGLPANYVAVGPKSNNSDQFGRPNPETDEIKITYVFLKPFSVNGDTGLPEIGEVEDGEVVSENWFGDKLRPYRHSIEFDDKGVLTAGSAGVKTISKDTQEYTWIISDSEGRPIGKKTSRLLLMYYMLNSLNVEITYAWRQRCIVHALFPNVSRAIGTPSSGVTSGVRAVTNPSQLQGNSFFLAGQLGEKTCLYAANCADHDIITFSKSRIEPEIIVRVPNPSNKSDSPSEVPKAFFAGVNTKAKNLAPGNSILAGGNIVNFNQFGPQNILSAQPAGTPYTFRRRGAMWYPYTQVCERPRYDVREDGPIGTGSSELINEELTPPGSSGSTALVATRATFGGTFGGLPEPYMEAYRAPDRITSHILSFNPNPFACRFDFTRGNTVVQGNPVFAGGYRVRGRIDAQLYSGKEWKFPPFGNLGRNRLSFEITDFVGDYIVGGISPITSFRWMPIFPTRENMSSEAWSENLQPMHSFILAESTPLGNLPEVVEEPSIQGSGQFTNRFEHKSLVIYSRADGIEYPFINFYHRFIPDNKLGVDVENRNDGGSTSTDTGVISTMWAWREPEAPIRRGLEGSKIIPGLSFSSPAYILDNRNMEVRLRPDEGVYVVSYTSPTYDSENGDLLTNATIKIGDGPEREIAIDFKNKKIEVLSEGIYNPETGLSNDEEEESSFPCPQDKSENGLVTNCICDVKPADFNQLEPGQNPSQLLHLDLLSIRPSPSHFSLFPNTEIRPPFITSFPRTAEEIADNAKPCCICNYYRRGIYFSVLFENLPTQRVVIGRDSSVEFEYAWSRVPHGTPEGGGQDAFDAIENLSDSYEEGQLFINKAASPFQVSPQEVVAFFPSQTLATSKEIPVTRDEDLSTPNPVGSNGRSIGETETVILNLKLSTFVRVVSAKIGFQVGKDMEIPIVILSAVDDLDSDAPATKRLSRNVAVFSPSVQGRNFEFNTNTTPHLENNEGFLEIIAAPSYAGLPFWQQFAKEFYFVFSARDPKFSMGIVSIELITDAMDTERTLTESIEIPERRYYTASSNPVAGKNPEQFLAVVESSTVYWKAATTEAQSGSNRTRATSWGEEMEDDQKWITGVDVKTAEAKQESEYVKAQNLMTSSSFAFKSFVPFEMQKFVEELLQEEVPSWNTNLTVSLSRLQDLKRVGSSDNTNTIFGSIPERSVFNPPGHAFTHGQRSLPSERCIANGPQNLVLTYDFGHLHDNISSIAEIRFWDENRGFFKIMGTDTLETISGQDLQESTILDEQNTLGVVGGTTLENGKTYDAISDGNGNTILKPRGN